MDNDIKEILYNIYKIIKFGKSQYSKILKDLLNILEGDVLNV